MRLPLALLLLAPLAASGQEAAPGTGRVAGVVTDAETGEPLVGAHVWIPALRIGGVADLDGHYDIEEVPPGEHTLEVRFVGYETTTAAAIVRPETTTTASVRVCPDDTASDCVIACAMPRPFGTGIYAARVVHHTWTFDCCSSATPPIHPAYVRLEDR